MWENLGWHYRAIKGVCRVHLHSATLGGGYIVFLNSRVQFLGDGDTPQEALDDAMDKARSAVGAILLDLVVLGMDFEDITEEILS